MSDGLMEELLNSATVMMASPQDVTPQQRSTAEQAFVNFQKMKQPFMLCKHILESCQNDFVLFQAASLMKNGLIREWETLTPSDVESIRSFLLQFIVKETNLKRFVREQVTMVLAVIVKRRSVGVKRAPLMVKEIEEVSQLIKNPDINLQNIGCSLLSAFLDEFSLCTRSSDLHMTLESHLRVKRLFEAVDLRKICEFCMEALHVIVKLDSLSSELKLLTGKLLSICLTIFSWQFNRIPIGMLKRLSRVSEWPNVGFRPPENWSNILFKPEYFEVFFKLQGKIRTDQELCHVNIQCLVQQSSLTGVIIRSVEENLHKTFLTNFIRLFLEYLSSYELLGHEALGISNTFNKLISTHAPIYFELSDDLKTAFFKKMTEITCQFACKAAAEEQIQKDDQIFMEAFETTLCAWFMFINSGEMKKDCYKQHFIEMFNCFAICHLSPPDGRRNEIVDGDYEIDELEEEDRLKFKDQLSVIGYFGRFVLSHSLPSLFHLIEERTSRLHGQLQRISHQGSGLNISDTTIMTMLFEDLHWLILLAGFVLMHESEGETALIPSAINYYSWKQSVNNVDLNVTLQILGSPGQKISDIPGSEHNSDHVIRLVSAVFRVCEVEKCALEANLVGYLSPQVSATIMWFLKSWIASYLLPSENFYDTISPTLLLAFGRDTEAGAWTVRFILNKICSNLSLWNAESSVMEETASCLVTLVSNKERASKVVNSEFWNIARNLESSDRATSLQSNTRRSLFKSLVLAATHCTENTESYLNQVLKPLQDKFNDVTSKQDFRTFHKEETVKVAVINFVESLIGLAEGCENCSNKALFPQTFSIFNDLVMLFELYNNYNQIVKLILEFYNSVVSRLFYVIGQVNNEQLCESFWRIIQIYVKHNKGKKTTEVNAEEENFEDLKLLLVVLLELLMKGNLEPNHEPEKLGDSSDGIYVTDLVFYGISSLMPLMTYELLKFPSLCKEYYKLISFLTNVCSKRVLQLPENVLLMLLQSIELGLKSFSPDATPLCLESISSLCIEISSNGCAESNIRQVLRPFLKIIMDYALFEVNALESDALISTAYFSALCCFQEEYKQMVEQFIQQQADPNHKMRLANAFNALTVGIELKITRRTKLEIRSRFDQFIYEVQGILCVI